MNLDALIEQELEASGFGKKAYNPFTTKEHGRPHPEDSKSSDGPRSSTDSSSSASRQLAEQVPAGSASATRLQDEGSAKAIHRNPIVAMKEAAAKGLPLKGILEKHAREKVSRNIGMSSRHEVLQAFTSSEDINRIKLAGMASALANLLPEELLVPLVRKFKGTSIFPAAADVESFLLGKGLRAAAEGQDLAKAKRLFEAAGGTPMIDPRQLAGLQAKAQAYDSSNPLFNAALMAGLGGLGGAGLHAYLQQANTSPDEVPQAMPFAVMKVGP